MNKKVSVIGLVVASLLFFGSCKPKQSAYKSVYEAAKEREIEQETTESSTKVAEPAVKYPATNETVRKEKITPVYESDASELKAYSVVIAAMGMKPNAESLKTRMVNEGHRIILVQNEQSMYRVIIGSYDSKEQAVSVKNNLLETFKGQGNQSQLRSRYGIPFNDWWILERTY